MTLLATASQDLAGATTPIDKVVARIRLAVYSARQGNDQLARSHIDNLRAEPTSAAYSLAIAGANLAEGVVAYCSSDQATAVDRLRRSQALAASARAESLERWANAWLAHVAFDAGNLDQVHERGALALQGVAREEHAVLARVCSTLGVALHFGDRYLEAKPWYDVAHRHAIAEGDDLMIDALLHNVAAIRANNLRLRQVDGRMSRDELDRADLEFRSSINYDRLKTSQSFRWTLPFLEAHLAVLREEYTTAAELLERWLSAGFSKAPERASADAKSELALCYAKLNRLGEAWRLVQEVRDSKKHDTSDDEVAMIKYRCHQVADLCGHSSDAQSLYLEARQALEAHSAEQAHVANAIDRIGSPSTLGLL